ncbi:carbohydrate ABC transporter permease [Paenibacillus nasutitermitis]|uniref:Protein LplC n=1 Tax=Paenibacillus nasutitermitis TaxID=1652958 RepID=A0A916YKE2_9BACL|nr:carbohydrate ABC transporter permease [Paenibacillus nasutitermitis]GGD48504.1 protein LplC [Paenibacillus nasutitermitis]
MIKQMNAEKAYQVVITILILLVSLSALLPLIYVLSTSLVSEQEYIQREGFVFIPRHPTIEPYKQLFGEIQFMNAFGISVARTVLGTLLILTLTSITAYTLSRKDIPGRNLLIWSVLVTILFTAGLIPNFLVVSDLHLKDTFWAMVIPGAIDSWSVLVLKQFFENIPRETEESAIIDGANELQLMSRIMLPMSLPVLAALGLFAAVGHWNAWFDAFIYISDTHLHPLQLFIHNLFVSSSPTALVGGNMSVNPVHRVSDETMKMALVVAGTLPILCVYPFLQKYFTKGMYLGAVKG